MSTHASTDCRRTPLRPLAIHHLALVCAAVCAFLWAGSRPAAAQIVIHEILQNPSAVSDADGEWFEIYNAGPGPVDVNGWTVADNDIDDFIITNGGPLVVPAGGYLVLGNNADSGTNGGVTVDYEYSGMFLANGADELVLFDTFANEIARVEWDGGPSFPDPNGASMSLIQPELDPLDGANWCEASTPFGAGDFGTPGAANDCVAAAPQIVVHEILQNPSAVSDSAGEWFEVYNAGGAPVDLDGWTVLDNDFDSFVISGSVVVPAGGYAVLGNNADTLTNGGVTVDYEYSGMFLANGGDEVVLLDGDLNEIDRVEYDGGPVFPDPNGASMSLIDPALDNNDGNNWCEASTPFGAGDLGTPGAANDCITVPSAPLVIHEIMQNPSAVSDGSGEWFEIYNPTAAPVDLDGWTVADNDSDSFVVSGSVVVPAGGYAVLGNNADLATNGGVVVAYEYSGMFLSNGADEVVLFDPALVEIDRVEYDGGAVFPDPNGASMAVIDATLDNNDGSNWCTSSTAFGAGDLGTPGAANDCATILEIFEIQGAGLASPVAGNTVTTLANVVTAVGPEGFFLQTPASRSDGNVATSDGIYVFTGGAPTVSVGDLVDVEGTVVEFFDFTEFAAGATITVVGTETVPAPVVFDAFTPSPDPTTPSCGAFEYECYEGMLVQVIGGRVTGPNQSFGTDPIAEVHVTASSVRALREPGVEFPGLMMPPIPTWDGNPEVFELDPDKLGLPNQIIPAGSSFDVVGALGYEFGGYELWATSLTVSPAELPRPVRVAGDDEVTVGSLNLFRLFDEVDDPPTQNAVGENRDDEVVPLAEYLVRRGKFASYIVEVLRAPEILAVQEVESQSVLEDLAGDIQALDPAVVYSAYVIEGNDVGTIDVGFLVRDNVQVQTVTQLGFGELFTFDDPPSPLHDRPPLVLEALVDGTFPITVMAIHGRSLGSIEGTRTQQKRLAQAESTAQMIQDIQTLDPNVNLVVTGDFNAYEFTDGYVDVTGIMKGDFDPAESLVSGADLVSPDLTDLVLTLPAEDRYSFVFRGNGQVLDHAMTSQNLDALITGFEFGRGNADAALLLLEDDGSVDPGHLPLRSSDHDGLVTFLFQDEDQDGITDGLDVCLGTSIPEVSVPSQGLGQNRYALLDGDGVFEVGGNGGGNAPTFTLEDTAGCSCEQIILAQGLGSGHEKFGCSRGEMEAWVELVNP